MNEIIVTGIITIITTAVGSVVTWVLAKRKYNAEVQNTLIKNLQESLDFYKNLCDDNNKRLLESINDNEKLRAENKELDKKIEDLRMQMFTIMGSICTDLTCQIRKKDLKLFNDGTKSKKTV